MNLLTLLPKRTVSKVKETEYTNDYFFSYDKRVITSHLDTRKVIFSNISREVTKSKVQEILNDIRR